MSKSEQNSIVDWQVELNASAFKYHVLVAWVAIILNPLWAIGDYFNSPTHFFEFFVFRATKFPFLI